MLKLVGQRMKGVHHSFGELIPDLKEFSGYNLAERMLTSIAQKE